MRASLGFQYATVGGFRAFPLHLAQPAARVDARLTPRRGEFLITLPPSNTLPARLSRAQQALLDRLVDEAAIEPTYEARLSATIPRSIAHTTSAYDIVHKAAERLTAAQSLDQFLREACSILAEDLAFSGIAVASGTASGTGRLLSSPRSRRDCRIHRALNVAGSEVGCIELDDPAGDDAHQRLAIFEELLPWIALGLEAAVKAEELGRRERALECEAEARKVAERELLEALEAISAEAFVVTGSGELLAANTSARKRPEFEEPTLRARWRNLAEGGTDPDYTAVPLTRAGLVAGKALVTRCRAGRDFESKLEEARAAWHLTYRQKDVLRQVLKGASNKEIGAALGCTEGTVENHMSSMLRRIGVDSRTTLAAKFWGVGEPPDGAGSSTRAG